MGLGAHFSASESGGGPPHSKTLARPLTPLAFAPAIACRLWFLLLCAPAEPLDLWLLAERLLRDWRTPPLRTRLTRSFNGSRS